MITLPDWLEREPPRRPIIKTADTTIALPIEMDPLLEFTPIITHAVECRDSFGFGDFQEYGDLQIKHQFEVKLDADALEVVMPIDQEWNPEFSYIKWDQLAHFATGTQHERYHDEEELLVAQVVVWEFPSPMAPRFGGWREWIEIDMGNLGLAHFIEQLAEREDDLDIEPGFALLGGSLYHFLDLAVHPQFRGQQIGARLMGHALFMLDRGTASDVAVVTPVPAPHVFGEGKKPWTDGDVERMISYCERLGFERLPKSIETSPDDPPALYALMGQYRLPFDLFEPDSD